MKQLFKATDTKGFYAIVTQTNRLYGPKFDRLGEKSALFQVNNCFECLTPNLSKA